MITALYASILGLLWFVLTFWVILGRWKYGVSLGDGQERDLNRRIRAHANFVETVPLALILLWGVESHAFHETLCHVFGVALCVSRLLHAARNALSQTDHQHSAPDWHGHHNGRHDRCSTLALWGLGTWNRPHLGPRSSFRTQKR